MVKRLLLVVSLLLLALPLMAADVTFQWDYGTPMPSGFEMTVTPTTGSPVVFDCGPAPEKTCTVQGLNAGSFTAYVRAYNVGVPATLKNYSEQSNTVSLTVPAKPNAPTNNRVFAAIMAGVTAIGIVLWALVKRFKKK
jgi:hypothetical protein